MALEINEIGIRMRVRDAKGARNAEKDEEDEDGEEDEEEDEGDECCEQMSREQMVEDCVRRVLKILKARRER